MKKKWLLLFLLLITLIFISYQNRKSFKRLYKFIVRKYRLRTVIQVLNNLDKKYKRKKFPNISKIDINQIDKIMMIALKKERQIEVWLKFKNKTKYRFSYIIKMEGFSGNLGPKIKRGDQQIPEGVYPITFLHPNSIFDISIKIGYPNQYDIKRTEKFGFNNPGGDIFIHKSNATVGCLAIGDLVYVEELFYIIGKIGKGNTSIIISPIDLRYKNENRLIPKKVLKENMKLYQTLKKELMNFTIK